MAGEAPAAGRPLETVSAPREGHGAANGELGSGPAAVPSSPAPATEPAVPAPPAGQTSRPWSEMDDGARRAWIHRTLARLATSAFRARFTLSAKDRAYALDRGEAVIRQHARDLLEKRVGPAEPARDGKQTPFRGHPVFTAQHACACCCRGCIEKWHRIPRGRALADDELDRLTALVIAWIRRDIARHR